MSGFDYFKKVVTQNYATFEGRARRAEYWYFQLFNLIFVLGLYILGILFIALGWNIIAFILMGLLLLLSLGLLLPSISVLVRRLHDTDRSGWWYWISLIPLIGTIVLFVFLATEGTKGTNRFGPDPKGSTADDKLADQLV